MRYRNELKHVVTEAEGMVLRNRLSCLMRADPNAGPDGTYFIRSLYFDTPENKAFHEKFEGMPLKEKFRIRLYNHDHGFIRLEKKVRSFDGCSKRHAVLTKEDVERILAGDIDFLKESEEPLLREFYLKLRTERYMPRVVTDYLREAYVCAAGNVRVTIDRDIKASVSSTDIFDVSLPTARVMNDGACVVEVKYDCFLPEYVQDVVQLNNCTTTTVSKYACSRIYM